MILTCTMDVFEPFYPSNKTRIYLVRIRILKIFILSLYPENATIDIYRNRTLDNGRLEIANNIKILKG